MSEPTLFPDLEPIPAPADPLEGLGRDARATIRKDELIRRGINPGTRLPLHARAAKGRDGDGLRCGTCTHLYRAEAGNKRFLKCEQAGVYNARHSWGPDMRAWWPACHRYTPTEGDSMTDEQPAPERQTDAQLRQLVAVEYPDDPGDTFFNHPVVDGLVSEVLELRALVDDLSHPDMVGPCSFDHDGSCQTHGWFNTEPRCPHARAAEILGARE